MTPTTFEQYLAAKNYRPTTQHTYANTLRQARTALAEGVAPPETAVYAVKAYVKWLDYARPDATRGDQELRDWLTRPRLQPRKVRKAPPDPFSPEDWERFVQALITDPDREARVLEVQAATGLRTGDVLRIRRRDLVQAIHSTGVLHIEVKGGAELARPISGAPEVWGRLLKQWRASEGAQLAEWIAPGSRDPEAGAAYFQVRRHFLLLAQDLNLAGRHNLHRIRHTVANTALQHTKNIYAVRSLLGHRSLNSTLRYVHDQDHLDDVATLQREIYPAKK